ncbi:hypothetical protein [Neorhodopirellula pilleata]|uniref:hypothetical protein n=1 Tax=Neorhodopirellula pilleata TaxID=2714738 RepID=UPI0018CF42D1|nr:hypothetical protein [Neorhodopirellula pilleata]
MNLDLGPASSFFLIKFASSVHEGRSTGGATTGVVAAGDVAEYREAALATIAIRRATAFSSSSLAWQGKLTQRQLLSIAGIGSAMRIAVVGEARIHDWRSPVRMATSASSAERVRKVESGLAEAAKIVIDAFSTKRHWI